MTVNPIPAPITSITVLCAGVPTTLGDITPGGTWTVVYVHTTIAVDTFTGMVTGTTVGSFFNISYTLVATGCFVHVGVNVDSAVAPIVGPDSVCLGSSTTLTDSTAGGIWTSTVLAIAQVFASGEVDGISAGTVNISYTVATGCYATKVFSVSPLTPAIVSVAQTPLTTLCAGDSVTLVATATHGGG